MMIRTSTALGAALRDRRRHLGWNQEELARKIGVRRQWIIAVEKGKPRAELGLVLRALDALDLRLSIAPRSSPHVDRDDGSDIDRAVDIDAIVEKAARRKPRR